MVVALLAVSLAAVGPANAVDVLRGVVTGKQIKNRSVKGEDIASRAIARRHFRRPAPSTVNLRGRYKIGKAFEAKGSGALILPLEAGAQVLLANATVNHPASPADFQGVTHDCQLSVVGPLGREEASAYDFARAEYPATTSHSLHLLVAPPESGYTARLECGDGGTDGDVYHPQLTAIRVRACCKRRK